MVLEHQSVLIHHDSITGTGSEPMFNHSNIYCNNATKEIENISSRILRERLVRENGIMLGEVHQDKYLVNVTSNFIQEFSKKDEFIMIVQNPSQ